MLWRGRDRTRFEQTVAEHLPALYRFALELAGRDEADDLVQAVVLRAWERRAMTRPDRSLRPWLFAILRNIWIDQVRRRRRTERQRAIDAAYTEDDRGADPAVVLAQRAVAQRVRDALQALPDAFRWPVYLKDVEGFEYREIAEILEVPIGTVMSRLSRGRALLRERLRDVALERAIGCEKVAQGGRRKQRHDLS